MRSILEHVELPLELRNNQGDQLFQLKYLHPPPPFPFQIEKIVVSIQLFQGGPNIPSKNALQVPRGIVA